MTDLTLFVNRLKACGFSPDSAALTVGDFLREHRGSYFELEEFVESIESKCYVGAV